MTERLFLYIDILGFKNLINSGSNVSELYEIIDDLNVHRDNDFTSIVFSDTILVYGEEFWNSHPNKGIMWLIEFAQDLFYRLIVKDIHFRAYVTFGDFNHFKLKHIEAYYGQALVDCYESEKRIQCTGVFLDSRLARFSDVFQLTPYNSECHFVHVMQHLDDIRAPYEGYPLSGAYLEATGMEWWVAYLLRYLENLSGHMADESLPTEVRQKYRKAWDMIATRHGGMMRRLQEANFKVEQVIEMDWTEPLARIGTPEGAWG
ncbi:hypothetical protein H7F51_11045 [Novosphingobium flavum]|uniref:Uncharacterized protein n=1 Tax=Novosphingobium flavum TaxID=1778672 RepID=A0A7X1FSB4_9SPHN|nr:hypothetical protein [Novosphingobium flavum]MBC2666053.1 hypothetical protein [Novosphingobium flavum]